MQPVQRPLGVFRRAAVPLAIVIATVIAYVPALRAGFVWDDDQNLTMNPSVRTGLSGLVRIWTNPHANQQFYPLTHTTFWIEWHLWGDAPFAYHLDNVLLHTASAVMIWVIVRRLRLDAATAGCAAALFALHPLQVESVAWVTERKNVLSLFLCLVSVAMWIASQKPAARTTPYLASIALFACALASKTAVATVPAALLVLAWHRGGGTLSKRELTRLAPHLGLGLAAGIATAHLERSHVGATGEGFGLSFVERLLVAARILWFYPAKCFWPHPLMFVYPRFPVGVADAAGWTLLGATLVVAAAVLGLALRARRTGPACVVGMYAICIFPALGFFNVYFMKWSFVQDHFAYVATVPLSVGAAALVVRISARAEANVVRAAVGAALAGALGAATFHRAAVFRTYETLFLDAIAQNPAAWMCEYNLARVYQGQGRLADAVALYERALASHPSDGTIEGNLGAALADSGRVSEAMPHFEAAVRLRPYDAEAHANLAVALSRTGAYARARGELEQARALAPNSIKIARLLAWILATAPDDSARDGAEAVRLAEWACERTRRTLPRCLDTLAAAYAEAGRFADAMAAADRAVSLVGSTDTPGAQRYAEHRDSYRRREPVRATTAGESEFHGHD